MAGNSTRWNNSKKSKRIENNKSRYEKYKRMKRPDGYAVAILTIIVTLIIVALIGFFTSCQTKKPDSLKDAKFECECIYKGFNYEVYIQCQDSNDIINEPSSIIQTEEWKKYDKKVMECGRFSLKSDLQLNVNLEKLKKLIQETDSLHKLVPYEKFK